MMAEWVDDYSCCAPLENTLMIPKCRASAKTSPLNAKLKLSPCSSTPSRPSCHHLYPSEWQLLFPSCWGQQLGCHPWLLSCFVPHSQRHQQILQNQILQNQILQNLTTSYQLYSFGLTEVTSSLLCTVSYPTSVLVSFLVPFLSYPYTLSSTWQPERSMKNKRKSDQLVFCCCCGEALP